jgi:hypothetical protein
MVMRVGLAAGRIATATRLIATAVAISQVMMT